MMNIVLAQVFLLLGSFAIMAFTDPIVIVVIVVVGVAYYRLQRFYRSSSRLLRRLDSAYRFNLLEPISKLNFSIDASVSGHQFFQFSVTAAPTLFALDHLAKQCRITSRYSCKMFWMIPNEYFSVSV